MSSDTGSYGADSVFRHESGAEITAEGVGYAAMHGDVRVEGNTGDDGVYLNGYRYERVEDHPGRPLSRVESPWPTTTLARSDFAEVCDVTEREATGGPFDYGGVEAGQLYVAYDAGPNSPHRDGATQERVYAVPEYQVALIEWPISHLTTRAMDDGLYHVVGYGPDGPSSRARTL